jgi:hypothetical protein
MKMNTSFLATLHSGISSLRSRLTVCVAAACVVGVLSARPADAQVVYTYQGNPFTVFSCDPDPEGGLICDIPAPLNPYTSYKTTDFVTATLTLDAALPANLSHQDITQWSGFQLVMNDRLQTLTVADAFLVNAFVSTDATGRITEWSLVLTAQRPDGSYHEIGSGGSGSFGGDLGALMEGEPPVIDHQDYAWSVTPGTWTTSVSGPDAAVRSLIATVSNSGLTNGQVNSLTSKLNDILASIAAGQRVQAINQLNAFINQVQAAGNNGKISAATAATLIAAANAIIAML